MKTFTWIRVTHKNPCKLCDHDSPCTFSSELGLLWCLRVSSDRPSKNTLGGWIHQMDGATRQQVKNAPRPVEAPVINVPKMLDEMAKTSVPAKIEWLAKDLGVAVSALVSIGCLWSVEYRAWAIPEHDGAGWPIGICLRYRDGKKTQVKGSHRGLFIPDKRSGARVFICEGASDVCAGLTLQFHAIGRPSASGGVAMIQDYLKRNRFDSAVIVPDMDGPGLTGAKTLQEHLPIPSCILPIPGKDLRSCLQNGMTRELIESIIKNLVWKH